MVAGRVKTVYAGSPAYEAGLRGGDIVIKINDTEIVDYLDYLFATREEIFKLFYERGGEAKMCLVCNPDFKPLGIEFETMLIDKPRSCMNKCVFCFIDQLPPKMRETCYFKDDDWRLSFLQGNYVSLTNMNESDVERILKYNIPRINVSVHTTNPQLRCRMLNNKRAGEVLDYIRRFAEGGISMHAQIVLCPDYNDGDELLRTIQDLSQYYPSVQSVSVVPVGVTKFRNSLVPLRQFDREGAGNVIHRVEMFQERYRRKFNVGFVYLADEFYLTACQVTPLPEMYDGFPQIENGVGMCASLTDEFMSAVKLNPDAVISKPVSMATGKLVYNTIRSLVIRIPGESVRMYSIRNDFFGDTITVSGLITGGDLIAQLKDKDLGEKLIISRSMLRQGEDVFLDDVTLKEVETALKVPVIPVENDGFELFDELIGGS